MLTLLIVIASSFSPSEDGFLGVPGTVVHHSPASTGRYVGSPSIEILGPDRLVASCEEFGPGRERQVTFVYRSEDAGRSWRRIAEVPDVGWAGLFRHRGALYLMGTSGGYGDIVIVRSNDGGESWTRPVDRSSGLLRDDRRYHTAPVPVLHHAGRLWRSFEDAEGGGGWGEHFRAVVVSAPEDADLLDSASWTVTRPLASDDGWLDERFGGWLEGNVVVAPSGELWNVMRADVRPGGGVGARLHIGSAEQALRFDPGRDFLELPGGCKKLSIQRDPDGGLYWALANWIAPADVGGNPERTRNTLALLRSEDLESWEVRSVVLHHPDRARHGFQYPDFRFDGLDLVAVSRTAFDDGQGGAHDQHDANFMTYHRIHDFRQRQGLEALDAAPTAAAEGRRVRVTGHGFDWRTLDLGARAYSNRDYTWLEVPPRLRGQQYTRVPGGEPARMIVETTGPGRVTLAAGAEAEADLAAAGFERIAEERLVYSDGSQTALEIWERPVEGGEKLHVPQHGWQGALLITPPFEVESRVGPLGMPLVRIPAGTYERGSESGEFDERPVHRVTLPRSFWIGATEVTNAQYEAFDLKHRERRGERGLSEADDEPVLFVSWEDAQRFCEWLSEQEGVPYRLPTEAEWEYACRSGTRTAFWTGEAPPEGRPRQAGEQWEPRPTELRVGQGRANPWGLFDMHGGVEEWCLDWYGPYAVGSQTDPIGPAEGLFRVTRGGSHSTTADYLRSANRMAAPPEERNWLIGFRVVQAPAPEGEPTPSPPAPLWAREVSPRPAPEAPDRPSPLFLDPIPFVLVPGDADGPLYAAHNHDPDIEVCRNGDLFAIWYSTRQEDGREHTILASRLRAGAEAWDAPDVFLKAADRNMHAPALLATRDGRLFHFNGIGASHGWSQLTLHVRESRDDGASWSPPRWIAREHGWRHMPIPGAIETRDEMMALPVDAVPGGNGGTGVWVSSDAGETWSDPASPDVPLRPKYAPGIAGGSIAGIHAGLVELEDGRWLAFGRGDSIEGRMPRSVSRDRGRTWRYAASPFPAIGGGQRLVLRRLQSGPLLFASFANGDGIELSDAAGGTSHGRGLFVALSYDEGETWPVRKLVTPGHGRWDGGAWTDDFEASPAQAEPKGYLAATQTPDGTIHLISSRLHYRFDRAWIEAPPPPADGRAFAMSLWPGDPPGDAPEGGPPKLERLDQGHVRGISEPTLTVHLPSPGERTGVAVLVCPGGAYGLLATEHEGRAVAEWLVSHGIAAGVLAYRHAPYRHPVPLLDAQRGLRTLRARGMAWGIDPRRVGVLGFSAGGHLAATLSVHGGEGEAGADDPVERLSARPDFSVLVYPVIDLVGAAAHLGSRRNLLGDQANDELAATLSLHRRVTPETPPAFLVHSADDGVSIANSELYEKACRQAGVPAKLARYETGGHGYGLGRGGPAEDWPERCIAWLREQGILSGD